MRTFALLGLLAGCGSVAAKPVAVPLQTSVAAPAPAPAPTPIHATKVRSVEGITEYSLPNGLRVLMFPDPSQATVTVDVTYLVGSRVEGYGETGMAHLLEHMMFKGSPRFRNVLKLVEARGGDGNGNTETDRTTYFETLPASPENLDWVLDLESDRMVHASISQDDLSTEFSVVRNEFEQGENDPAQILESRIIATAFLWHSYGKDVIGSRTDIERVPITALRRFYTKYYQPDDAVLVVAGRFDEAAALADVERRFGALPRPTRVLEPTYTIEPQQDGERTVTLRRTGDVAVVGAAYHTVGAASPDFPAVQAALDVLTHEPSGLLYKQLVETNLAAEVDGDQAKYRDPFLAMVVAQVRHPADADKVQAIMTRAIEHLGDGPIDDKAVARWRNATRKKLVLLFSSSADLAIALADWSALGDWRTLFAYRARVETTTAADVRRVAQTYFKRSNRTTGQFLPTAAPDRAPLTDTPDLAAVVAPITGADGNAGAQGEAFAATFDNIDARTQRSEPVPGLKLALLPKATRRGKVSVDIQLDFGDARALRGKAMLAALTAAMLERGTTKRSFQDIADREDELTSEINTTAQVTALTMTIDTLRASLPDALALGAELLRSPAFSAQQLEQVRQRALAELEDKLQDPESLASIAWQRLRAPWPADHPRYHQTTAEKIATLKAIKLADIKAFYAELIGAGHAEIAAVGDFDAAALSAQIVQLFGGWHARVPFARIPDQVFAVAGTDQVIEVHDKESAQLITGESVALRDTDPDYPAWLLAGQILGGDSGSRLWMRLREHEGLSYFVEGRTYASPVDDVGGLMCTAQIAPQNVDKAKASLFDELGALGHRPIGDAELQRAKDALIKTEQTELSDDKQVVDMLIDQLFYDRTSAWMAALDAKVRAVTAADVARVVGKYFQPDRLITVEVLDRAKAAAHRPTAP